MKCLREKDESLMTLLQGTYVHEFHVQQRREWERIPSAYVGLKNVDRIIMTIFQYTHSSNDVPTN